MIYEELFTKQQKAPQDPATIYKQLTAESISAVNYVESGGKVFYAYYITPQGKYCCVNNMGFHCNTSQQQYGNNLPCCYHIRGLLEYEYQKNPNTLSAFFKVAHEDLAWKAYQEKLAGEITFAQTLDTIPGLFERSLANIKMLSLPRKESSSLLFADEIIRVSPKL